MSEMSNNQEIKVIATPEEAIRLTANTVRHHINNSLGAIIGFPDLLERMPEIENNPKVLAYIGSIRQAGERLAYYSALLESLDPNYIVMIFGTNIIDLEESVKRSNPQESETKI